MSSEPERRAPYSSDLCWRIVWQHIGMECSLQTIAESMNISLGTAFNVFRRFEYPGEVEPKHRKYSGSIVDNSTVLDIVLDNPFISLRDSTKHI